MRGKDVVLDKVSMSFGDFVAVQPTDLKITAGEFFSILGPSGCGKTTILRMVSGFLGPTTGTIAIGGEPMAGVGPNRRPTALIFQNLALFPLMPVWENVAFGLECRGVPKEDRRRRAGELLELVALTGQGHKKPTELSGGQRQRVAVARALAVEPAVLLLDEPLSALDLKIRLEMEVELRRLHREIGGTFIYVTHDQREALALSDRVVVFNQGRIEQIGAPNEVYRRPASPFVARFVGDANVIPVDVDRVDDGAAEVTVGGHRFRTPASDVMGPAWLVLRPEVVGVSVPSDDRALRGVVRDLSFRGTGHSYRVVVDGVRDPVKAEVSGGSGIDLGATVDLTWDPEACRLLPRDLDED